MTDLGHWESEIRQSRVWPSTDPGAKPCLTSACEAPVLPDQVLLTPKAGDTGVITTVRGACLLKPPSWVQKVLGYCA